MKTESISKLYQICKNSYTRVYTCVCVRVCVCAIIFPLCMHTWRCVCLQASLKSVNGHVLLTDKVLFILLERTVRSVCLFRHSVSLITFLLSCIFTFSRPPMSLDVFAEKFIWFFSFHTFQFILLSFIVNSGLEY